MQESAENRDIVTEALVTQHTHARTEVEYSNWFLITPTYGYRTCEDGLNPPTLREVLLEWADAMNFFKNSSRFLIASNFLFHFATLLVFASFLCYQASLPTVLFLIGSLVFIGTVYNTLWYHRYCSDMTFTFSSASYAMPFLWTAPLFFRESTYAVPHRAHHQRTERAGDPYGPHFGWLGCYLAIDSSMKFNTNITERQYELLIRMISHIGFRINGYVPFKRTGSIESLPYYFAKTTFAQLFWSVPIYFIAGLPYLMAWYSAIFIATALIRDFNWRGHGGNFRKFKKPGWEFDTRSHALNQHFYGYIASEWHDNHHKYPMSANTGFLPGQIDIAFQIIKLMHKLGIVQSYMNAKPIFEKECLDSAVRA